MRACVCVCVPSTDVIPLPAYATPPYRSGGLCVRDPSPNSRRARPAALSRHYGPVAAVPVRVQPASGVVPLPAQILPQPGHHGQGRPLQVWHKELQQGLSVHLLCAPETAVSMGRGDLAKRASKLPTFEGMSELLGVGVFWGPGLMNTEEGGEDPVAEAQIKTIRLIMQKKPSFWKQSYGRDFKSLKGGLFVGTLPRNSDHCG